MRQINRKPLNLSRETLQSLSKESLANAAGGGITDYTRYTDQIVDTVRRATQLIPTRNCSIGKVCA